MLVEMATDWTLWFTVCAIFILVGVGLKGGEKK